jgi:hypothetical protein
MPPSPAMWKLKSLATLPKAVLHRCPAIFWIFEKSFIGYWQGFCAFAEGPSIEVFDLKSLREDSRPIESMVFCPSSEISHSANSFDALGSGAFT